jgi:hypothetical protein
MFKFFKFDYALMLVVALGVYGCASPGKVISQNRLNAFLANTFGTTPPAEIYISKFYKDELVVDTTSTYFLCNQGQTLKLLTLEILSKHEGNYVEFTISSARECGSGLIQYKLEGRYDKNFVYLKRMGNEASFMFVYRIIDAGKRLKRVGTYKDRDGAVIYEEYSGGDDDWFATSDPKGVIDDQRYYLSLNGRNEVVDNGPSTASQLLQLTGMIAQQYQSNQAAAAVENRARSQEFNQRQADVQAGIARDQQRFAGASSKQANGATDSRASNSDQTASQQEDDKQHHQQKRRKRYVQNGFNDNGVMAATSELAIKLDYDQVKKQAEKWVAERTHDGVPAHAVIIDITTRECTAMGGNPLYRRCILDVTYESDD